MNENQDTRPRDDAGAARLNFESMGDTPSGDGGSKQVPETGAYRGGQVFQFPTMEANYKSETDESLENQKNHLQDHYSRSRLDDLQRITNIAGTPRQLDSIRSSGLGNNKEFIDGLFEFEPQFQAWEQKYAETDFDHPVNRDEAFRAKSELRELFNRAVEHAKSKHIKRFGPIQGDLDLTEWGF